MVTRESSLRDTFDPAAFHRSTSASQRGWAERDIHRRRSGFQDRIARFAGTITTILGALVAFTLRPPVITDTRDVLVSAGAIGFSLIAGMVLAKIVMSFFETSVEFDRVVMWTGALFVALAVGVVGVVPDYAREADDYVTASPGHSLTSSSAYATYGLIKDDPAFADVALWELDQVEATAVAAFVLADASASPRVTDERFLSHALADIDRVHFGRLDGTSVFVDANARRAHVGWLEGSALVVVSGRTRASVEAAALDLLRARR